MVFSSLFFLYAFFPICMLLYVLARTTPARNVVLLIFSLLFYAWGEPIYMLLLIGMAFFDWLFTLQMPKGHAKLWLVLACVVNLGILGVFKYCNFIADNISAIFGADSPIPTIALPIGISFYTFQLLSYVIDVYRGEVAPQKRFATVLLYASLFHQCIAGPIVRYADVENELTARRVNAADVSEGIRRFCVGLGKKVIIANTCGNLADTLIAGGDGSITLASVTAAPASALWVSMLAYTLQIYFDFSAYSDMAIGMGRMIGFHYLENFNYPYIAASVKDFWRRWHMSLSTFFRDYVYIPLGGSRRSLGRTVFNMFIVWALTGLWHGASWNFVLWGLWFFVFLAAETLFLGKALKKAPIVGVLYTLIVVYFGWVLFRFQDAEVMLAVLRGMFGVGGNPWASFETTLLIKNHAFFLPAAMVGATPVFAVLSRRWAALGKQNGLAATSYAVAQLVWPFVLLFVSTILLVGNSYNPFLYFQF
ncbi:MAG: MBOAT family protein [Clostridia bacterium]|nr:MBOAT family protein [Clostridia bacterium]